MSAPGQVLLRALRVQGEYNNYNTITTTNNCASGQSKFSACVSYHLEHERGAPPRGEGREHRALGEKERWRLELLEHELR